MMAGGVLTAECPYCGAGPGDPCVTVRGGYSPQPTRARTPHGSRRRLAVVLAAHADPALDRFFARTGQCGLCGTPGLDARHRRVDGIAGMLAAGEDPVVVAEEYGTTMGGIEAVQEWVNRWPGAWR